MINLILAMDESNLIGKDDKIPWHIKEDLVYFKSIVKDKNVIMGYNTFLSLKKYYQNKKLPYKKIYLLSKKKLLNLDDNIELINDKNIILKNNKLEYFVIGGLSVYKEFFSISEYIYLSRIKGVYKGNIYYDDFNLKDFILTYQKETELVIYQVYKRG